MKKTILSAVALTMLLPATYAQSVDSSSTTSTTSAIKTKWGFDATTSSQIKVLTSDASSVSLQFPMLTDGQGNQVYSYKVYYSKKDILEAGIDEVQQVSINLASSNNSTDKVQFTYNQGDTTASVKLLGLDANTKYYIFLSPQTTAGASGDVSDTLTATTAAATNSSTTSTIESASSDISTHAAATDSSSSAAMTSETLKNVSYAQNQDQVTLSWAAVSGSDKVQVFLRKDTQSDSEYQQVATANASDGKAIITVPGVGTYMAKLVLTNTNGETVFSKVLAVKIDKIATPAPVSSSASSVSSTPAPTPTPTPTKVIVKTPHVGPTQDALMLVMVLSALGYTAFRIRQTSK